MKKIIYLYIFISIIFGIFTLYQYIIEHIQLKYGSDDFNSIGENPYDVIKTQSNDIINYLYFVGIYVIISIIIAIYILRKAKDKIYV